LAAGVPDLFPRLRVAFIEAGSSWVPYVLDDYWARHHRQVIDVMEERQSLPAADRRDLFKKSRFYVAYQTHENLRTLLDCGLEDGLIIGTDYCHSDQAADTNMLKTFQQRAAQDEISETVVRKMLDDNPSRLYGL